MKSCYFCKGKLRRQEIEHMHEWGGRRFLIRSVNADVCNQCGETFLSPKTLKEIDRLVNTEKPDGRVSVAVFEMKKRAA